VIVTWFWPSLVAIVVVLVIGISAYDDRKRRRDMAREYDRYRQADDDEA
jgi:hypothetical protein